MFYAWHLDISQAGENLIYTPRRAVHYGTLSEKEIQHFSEPKATKFVPYGRFIL
jgi:hypothetical protein